MQYGFTCQVCGNHGYPNTEAFRKRCLQDCIEKITLQSEVKERKKERSERQNEFLTTMESIGLNCN